MSAVSVDLVYGVRIAPKDLPGGWHADAGADAVQYAPDGLESAQAWLYDSPLSTIWYVPESEREIIECKWSAPQAILELTPDMFDVLTLEIYNETIAQAFAAHDIPVPGKPAWMIVVRIG